MPEGDTVWRTATRLTWPSPAARSSSPTCAGRRSRRPTSRGRTTLEVVSRGKHLLHRVEGGLTLHSHLRMEGQWRVEATPGLPARWRRNPQLRALVAAPDWTALGLRLGMLDLVPTVREGDLVGHLGPDVLGPDWDLGSPSTTSRGPGYRSVRRCSTSATSPASARCGAPRRSSSSGCPRGASPTSWAARPSSGSCRAPTVSSTTAVVTRCSRAPAASASTRPTTSTPAAAGPADAAARRSASR